MNKESNKSKISFKDDLYDRYDLCKNITKNILMNEADNLTVLALDGKWGTGKTHTVRMWKHELENDNFGMLEDLNRMHPIYFDSWEYDDWSDALMPLISQIVNDFEKDKKFLNSLLRITKRYATNIGKAKVYAISKKIFGEETVEAVLNTPTNNLTSFDIDEEFSQYKNDKLEIKKFLSAYQEKKGKRIVIFVDELDRCKPTFAIQLLEVIKHLFSIKNYSFIISCNILQLSYSLEAVYGVNTDTINYLNRFFDYKLRLPEPKTHQVIRNELSKTNISFDNKFVNHEKIYISYLSSISDSLSLSIRQSILLTKYLVLFVQSKFDNFIKESNIIPLISFTVFIALKLYKPQTYNRILISDTTYILSSDKIIIKENISNSNIIFSSSIKVADSETLNTSKKVYLKPKSVFLKKQFNFSNSKEKLLIKDGSGFSRDILDYAYMLEYNKVFGASRKALYNYYSSGRNIVDYIKNQIEFYDNIVTD